MNTDEIETLTVEQATALAKHEGYYLSLDGLITLSDEAATALAKYEGSLYLDGLTTLSDEAAAALRANDDISLPDKFE